MVRNLPDRESANSSISVNTAGLPAIDSNFSDFGDRFLPNIWIDTYQVQVFWEQESLELVNLNKTVFIYTE